ncbi:DUF4351 domain-containing protein [Candidatus Cyanaurora vandensis]|uniref:DUF4351 domain-containing protein n=1 Tax=Candidatus Cyanaurora vandensis TaxID=2714958 RepID=UPI00257D7CD3|nr:DUF4351 domain-containing protein [Candidatus Cyanaurora vandensis]
MIQIVTSWLEEGMARGLVQGRQEGLAQGEQRGRQQEALSLVLRQLTRRVGPLPTAVQQQVEQLSLRQLESLGEALLDFADRPDLEGWLAQC